MSARKTSPKRRRTGEDMYTTPRSNRASTPAAFDDERLPLRLTNIPHMLPSPNQGKLQLSVWTAAWFKRISELLPNHKPPTIPLIHVVGHEWHISFASFHETHIEVAEELGMGDTRTIIGLYQLIASLRKLGDWIETRYRTWAEEAFMQGRETTAQ